MKSALLAEPECKEHHTGLDHPERPERFDAIVQALHRTGLAAAMLPVEGREATEDELTACHSPHYLRVARHDIAMLERTQGVSSLSTGDTTVGPHSWRVAVRAAGGVLNAVDLVAARKAKNAFCVVRPPGHHATPKRGMGFCIINNVAVAARYAQRKHGIDRVLIVDWDVHHGNGTQDIFYHDGSVLFFSTHQYPWYPGTGAAHETGEGKGKGKIVNCPFPAGSGRPEISGAFRDKLLPAAHAFKPGLVLISAGFDSRDGDPLGRFTLSDADFAELTRICLEIAGQHAGGRLVSVLEGGYNLHGLGAAAASHARALTEA